MLATFDIGTLITRDPKIRKGRPIIAGTGVTVLRIVVWHKMGLSPQEIADNFGHITLAQVHAALTYYYAKTDEIERDIVEDAKAADAAEQEEARRRGLGR